jgi:hypothetical protein
MNPIAAAIASTLTSELVRHVLRSGTAGPPSVASNPNTKIGEEYMPHWEEIMGDDDDFGEIGAELDVIGGSGTAEIVGDDEYGEDFEGEEDLLHALSIGAARHAQRGHHRKATAMQRAARKLAMYRKIDPGAVAVKQRELSKRRRFPLGFQPTTVAPGATSSIPAAPQDMFRPERLVIPSDTAFDFGIQDVKVGNTSQLVSGGEVPAAMFTEVSIDTHVHFKTAEIGNQLSVSVRNKTAAAIEFSAGVVGTVVQA